MCTKQSRVCSGRASACDSTRAPCSLAIAPAPGAHMALPSPLNVDTSAAVSGRASPLSPSHAPPRARKPPPEKGAEPGGARPGEGRSCYSIEDLSAWYAAHAISESGPQWPLSSPSQPGPSRFLPDYNAAPHGEPVARRVLAGSAAYPALGLRQQGGPCQDKGYPGPPADGYADLYPCAPSWGEEACEGVALVPGGFQSASIGAEASIPLWEPQTQKLPHSRSLQHPQGQHTRAAEQRRGPKLEPQPADSVEVFVLDSWQPAVGLRHQGPGMHSAAATLLPIAGAGVPGVQLAVYPGSHCSVQSRSPKREHLRGIPEHGQTLGVGVASPTKPKEPRSPSSVRRPSSSRRMLVRAHSDRPQRRSGPAMGVSPRRRLAKAQSDKEWKPKSILVVDKQEYFARTSPLDRRVSFREYVDIFVFS